MEGLSNLSKREIVSLFFLTTEFLSFSIQDNNKQDFRREKRSRMDNFSLLVGRTVLQANTF